MRQFLLISGILLAGCVSNTNLVSSQTSSANTSPESTQIIRLITSTDDGITWNAYSNPALGFAFDYPERVWDESAKIERTTYTEPIALDPADMQDFLQTKIGSLAPFQSTAIILGIQNASPEFAFYADNTTNEDSIREMVTKRFGPTCQVSLHSINSDISRIIIQWGKGEDLMTRKCLIPNVSNWIIFSQSQGKMLSLFMGQEIRFASKEIVEEPNYRGYDGFISRSLRFIDSNKSTN